MAKKKTISLKSDPPPSATIHQEINLAVMEVRAILKRSNQDLGEVIDRLIRLSPPQEDPGPKRSQKWYKKYLEGKRL